MARELIYSFGANTQGIDDGVQEVKAKLDELLRANLEHARSTNQVYSEMTSAQQDEFRARFDSEAEFQMASLELRNKRAEAEGAAMREYRDETKKLFADVTREAEDASRSIADTTEEGFGKAGDSAKDLGSTVSGELTDAFRSFDGTATGALEGTVELLGGAAALLPGVGAAAGVTFTEVGKSIISGIAGSTEAAAARAEKRIDSMYETLLDSGRNYFERAELEERIREAWDDEDMVRRATNVANALKIPVQAAMAALVENGSTAQQMLSDLNAKLEEMYDNPTGPGRLVGRFEAARDSIIQVNDEFDTTLSKVQLVRQTLDYLPGGVTDTLAAVDDLGGALDRLERPRSIPVEVGVDEALAEAERKIGAFISKHRNLRIGIGVADGTRYIT